MSGSSAADQRAANGSETSALGCCAVVAAGGGEDAAAFAVQVCCRTDKMDGLALSSVGVSAHDTEIRRVYVVSDERCMHKGLVLPAGSADTLEQMVRVRLESMLPAEAIKRMRWGWARSDERAGKQGNAVPVWVLAVAEDALAANASTQDEAGFVSETLALAAWACRPSNNPSDERTTDNEPVNDLWLGVWRGQTRALWLRSEADGHRRIQAIAIADNALETDVSGSGTGLGGAAWIDSVQPAVDACLASAADFGVTEARPARVCVLAETDTEVVAELGRRLGMQTVACDTLLTEADRLLAQPTTPGQTESTDAWQQRVDRLLAAGAALLAVSPSAWALDKRWNADGRSRAGGLAGVPLIGLDDSAQLAEAQRQAGKRRWWVVAAAAAWAALMLFIVVQHDRGSATKLGDAVTAAGIRAQDESILRQQTALFRYLENQGPTPLAIVDEVGRLTERYMVASFSFDAQGQVRLTGKMRDRQAIAKLVTALAEAKTLDSVQIKSQKKQGDDTVFEILAQPMDVFFSVLVPETKSSSTDPSASGQEGGLDGDG